MAPVHFATRYGATLSYLRYQLESGEKSVIFSAITYPDVATAILSCPCNSYMVDIAPNSELPNMDQVAEIIKDDGKDCILVVSQIASQYAPDSPSFTPLYVSSDLFDGTQYGVCSTNPVLPSAAVFRGDSTVEAKLKENSTNPLGGDDTALTHTQSDRLADIDYLEETGKVLEDITKCVEYVSDRGLHVLSRKSAIITVQVVDAVAKAETLRAAGCDVGSPAVPLHRILQAAEVDDYPNADKFISTHLSFPYDSDYKAITEVLSE